MKMSWEGASMCVPRISSGKNRLFYCKLSDVSRKLDENGT